MSAKRQATTELNHENWDKEDPSEHEEPGTFKTAAQDVLEKRVIRTAKRRFAASDTEPKKPVFSGFGGFNTPPPSSFDFLSKLTNGVKPKQDDESVAKPVTSSPLNTSTSISANGGFFGTPVTSTPSKPTFGMAGNQSTTFGGPTSKSSSFSTTINNAGDMTFKGPSSEQKSTTHSNLNSTSENTSQSLFSQNSGLTGNQNKTTSEIKNNNVKQEPEDENKMRYYSKLKGLNESVLDWIRKHVQETPLCILSPIFKDYEKHLSEIQDEYDGSKRSSDISTKDSKSSLGSSSKATDSGSSSATSVTSDSSSNPTMFSGKVQGKITPSDGKTATFNFGMKPANSSVTTAAGSFGTSTITANSSSPFTLGTTNSNGTSPFSFGTGKPFSFNTSVQQKPAEEATTEDAEDEPPKVEFTPVVEENSVLDKKCKIFVKKDGNFVDKGVGTLYVKKVEGSEKHQLLVRANTNLGNILLNLILTADTPTQRLGKNNVMMVCIPTPDSKPPPVPVLIRVKTSEEADELLESLNKFKA